MIIRSARWRTGSGNQPAGVQDLVKRSTRILEEYEEKLHLVEKFLAVEKVHEIHGLTQHYEGKDLNQVMNPWIETLSHSILEEL